MRWGAMLLRCVLLSVFGAALPVIAQPVIGSPPRAALVPPALRSSSGAMAQSTVLGSAVGMLQQIDPFHWGPVTLHPHLNEQLIYSDGLQAQPGHSLNSYINTLSPGVSADIGSTLTFDYTASWVVYSNSQFDESL